MYWYDSLYVSESMLGNEQKLYNKINSFHLFVKGYFVCLSNNPANLFEIISARELSQKAYPKKNLHVIGICTTKDEAIELVAGIIQKYADASITDTSTQIREQFEGRWRDSFDFS